MNKITVIVFSLFVSMQAAAWDGYDYDSGTYIEIDKGNLVRSGETIEIYDYEDGSYKDVEVTNIQSSGSGAEVEVYDYNTGESRVFDME